MVVPILSEDQGKIVVEFTSTRFHHNLGSDDREYVPPAKTSKLRNDISHFAQLELETLYDACERFKDLLRRFLYHGLPLWLQLQTFYNSLNPSTRIMDTIAGGTLKNKTPKATQEFFEEMALNNYQ
ncbi:Retrotransposon gag protein [Gossypium australe]|uniref:Retrotransposon gag protein n=1 Tax=Gossypium australe TaxID=47621 RepID=A0A5B6VVH2_9ROSI|nr:Retrotransposon gag protein [Gossypium australe]